MESQAEGETIKSQAAWEDLWKFRWDEKTSRESGRTAERCRARQGLKVPKHEIFDFVYFASKESIWPPET
jgi:hypothetical protein